MVKNFIYVIHTGLVFNLCNDLHPAVMLIKNFLYLNYILLVPHK